MKRIVGAFIALFFVSTVFADTVEINGVYYELHGDGTATVVDNPQKYSGDIVIPESFSYLGKEYSVTSIKGGICTDDFEWLNRGAFYNCSSLTSITIPQSITYIGKAAFDGCEGLQKVCITSLEKWCNIDFDIRVLGPYTGHYVYNLKSNPLYYAHDLYLNNEKITDLTIPQSVNEIKSSTFIGGSFETVSFPSNVSKLCEFAFQLCNSLMDVYCYGKEIDFDNQYAAVFDNHSTKTLHIREKYKDNYIREIYTESQERLYEWNKFGTLKYIEGIDFRLRYYVDGVLYKDYELEKGDIITPEAYPKKEGYTFDGWSDIPETMPDHDVNVTGTFSPNTYKLTYYVDGELYKVVDVKCDESVETEPYPEKEGNTFSGWHGLPETMPANDVNVYGTFSVNKYKLTFLVDDVEYASYSIDYGSATRVPGNNPKKENYEFVSWSEIPATMPAKNITSTASFKKVSTDIDGIKYKYVGDEAYVIGNNTSGIVKVLSSFEEDGKTYTVTVIDKNAFRNNTSITSVEIPNSIVAINDSAFFGCRNLTNIYLGNYVRVVGERAFANIDKLTDVVCYAEEIPETDRTAFENSYIDYVTLHVPAGSVEKYKATGPWKDFKEIVAIEGTEPISGETCVMPTISFFDGKLKFESETDGSECHYEINVEDAKEGVGSEVTLSSAYEISVYASKEGYNDSPKNTATLYWINVDPTTTGVIENEIRVNTNAILVQNIGGAIAISGVADGDNVLIYNISGQLIAQGKVSGNHVEIDTNLYNGDICIIKIADMSVKYLLK